jgi:hypothetical protein
MTLVKPAVLFGSPSYAHIWGASVWKLTDEQRGQLTSRQFIRAHLIRLGIGNKLSHITRGGTKRPLASVEEVLALRPELRGPSAGESMSG